MGFFLDQVKGRLRQDELKIRLYHPQHVIREKRQRLADQEERLERIMDARTGENRSRLQSREERLPPWTGGWKTTKKAGRGQRRSWGLSPFEKAEPGLWIYRGSGGENGWALVKQAPPGAGSPGTGGRRNAFGPGNGKE